MNDTIDTAIAAVEAEAAPAPRKRTIKPPVEQIVITKAAEEPAEEVEAPLSEQTKREMEAGRRNLENFR